MNNISTSANTVDTHALEQGVKSMYRRVALNPEGAFHFEMGRTMAERLGYSPAILNRVPAAAMESFAGVGHHFDLASLNKGERVVDLGSGSGLDTFVASLKVGSKGVVVGVDMSPEQREKSERLRVQGGFSNVSYRDGYINALPYEDGTFDCVISNGVINLVADKAAVFSEAARVLRKGGRLAISDIITEKHLPSNITCDATLWAACIGGAMQQQDYQDAIEAAGFEITQVQPNPSYRFITDNADGAAQKYGVKSTSLLAIKR